MAERKRKTPSRKDDQKANKRSRDCEETKRNETVHSVYFNGGQTTDLPKRLGEDFFTQPCVALAKAFLGKVTSVASGGRHHRNSSQATLFSTLIVIKS